MIPKFNLFFKPILEALSGKGQLSKNDSHNYIVDYFSLTIKDKEALTKGGNNVLNSRISWAFVYFKKAEAIRSSSRGIYNITPVGEKILSQKLDIIRNVDLAQFSPNSSKFQYIPKYGINDKRYKSSKQ